VTGPDRAYGEPVGGLLLTRRQSLTLLACVLVFAAVLIVPDGITEDRRANHFHEVAATGVREPAVVVEPVRLARGCSGAVVRYEHGAPDRAQVEAAASTCLEEATPVTVAHDPAKPADAVIVGHEPTRGNLRLDLVLLIVMCVGIFGTLEYQRSRATGDDRTMLQREEKREEQRRRRRARRR
jgi:hypothetical protein